MNLFQPFFSLAELAANWGTSIDFWRRKAKSGALGAYVVLPGGDIRVPLSGLAGFITPLVREPRSFSRITEPQAKEFQPGIVARSQGELLRKANSQ